MAEKKIQENPLQESREPTEKQKEMGPKVQETTVVVPTAGAPEAEAGRLAALGGMLAISKTSPNDLYRRLLPAVLFLMTFVTVMTMLLIYMDTVALGAQQFRLNMSRDYELSRIEQDEPSLVAYVRQLHLAPRPPAIDLPPLKTSRVPILEEIFGSDYTGTFAEVLPRGPRDDTTRWLEARGWAGVVARAAPRDYLALRGAARTLHACLSPTRHPREVSYHTEEAGGFRSRVLCLPLYTTLLAGSLTRAHYLLLGGEHAPASLRTLPYHLVHIQVIEVRLPNDATRNKTTEFLLAHNYTVKADFDDAVMYTLNDRKEA